MLLFQTTLFFRKPFPFLFTAVLALFMASCQESPPPTEPDVESIVPSSTTTRMSVSPENAQELQKQQEDFEKLKQMPSFPGGIEAVTTYLKANLKYPEQEKADGITENIVVNFTVQADGTITNVKNMNGENQNLIDASISVVENMPKWEPAIGEDGEPTESSFMLPINWTLRNTE